MNSAINELTTGEFKCLCERLVGYTSKDPDIEVIGVYRGDKVSVSVLVKEEFGDKVIMVIL